MRPLLIILQGRCMADPLEAAPGITRGQGIGAGAAHGAAMESEAVHAGKIEKMLELLVLRVLRAKGPDEPAAATVEADPFSGVPVKLGDLLIDEDGRAHLRVDARRQHMQFTQAVNARLLQLSSHDDPRIDLDIVASTGAPACSPSLWWEALSKLEGVRTVNFKRTRRVTP